MRLTFLGSGDAFCDWRVNYNNNAVVETDEGLLLIDCGLTALQSMRELELSSHDLAAVLVTHVHADHATLASLLLDRFYGGSDGPAWQATPVMCPPDVLFDLRRTLSPFFEGTTGPEGGHWPGEDGPSNLDIVLLGEPTFETRIGGVGIRFFPVPHARGDGRDKPSYGLELERDGKRIIWSSDTTFRAGWIVETARDPSVAAFFHECTFSPRFDQSVHTHFEELETLPADVKARLTLMHHVAVPDGVDVSAYNGAADRHDAFEV